VPRFEQLADAIAQVKPDLVFDVTVPEAHDKVVIPALQAGCQVLGEKPMSVSTERARSMVQAADQAGRLYAVIQNYRYRPPIQAFRSFLASGRLGPIEELHADFYLGPHFGGFRDEMDFPLILDMAVHTFDAARFISGADPVSVYCHAFNPKRSWYKGDASAVAIFEMSDGLVFSYRGSWCAEGCGTSWNSEWRAVCHNGTAVWDGNEDLRAQAMDKTDAQGFMRELNDVEIPVGEMAHQGHGAIIREFINCVQSGQTPGTECHDNIKSLAMVMAAVKSAKSGQKEAVEW